MNKMRIVILPIIVFPRYCYDFALLSHLVVEVVLEKIGPNTIDMTELSVKPSLFSKSSFHAVWLCRQNSGHHLEDDLVSWGKSDIVCQWLEGFGQGVSCDKTFSQLL